MAKLTIKDEIYAKLARKAIAQNTTVESFVEQLLDGLAGAEPELPAGASTPTATHRASAFAEWMAQVEQRAGRYPTGFVLDDGRASMYEGRGE